MDLHGRDQGGGKANGAQVTEIGRAYAKGGT